MNFVLTCAEDDAHSDLSEYMKYRNVGVIVTFALLNAPAAARVANCDQLTTGASMVCTVLRVSVCEEQVVRTRCRELDSCFVD